MARKIASNQENRNFGVPFRCDPGPDPRDDGRWGYETDRVAPRPGVAARAFEIQACEGMAFAGGFRCIDRRRRAGNGRRRVRSLRRERIVYVDDIADIRALRPSVALSITIERRAIRLGNLLAGELFIQREKVRHAVALLQVVAENHFRGRPHLDHDLAWTVSEFEETQRCEVAGAAVFVAFASGRAKDDGLIKTVTGALVDELALIHQHAIETVPNSSLQLQLADPSPSMAARPSLGVNPDTTAGAKERGSEIADSAQPGRETNDTASTERRHRGLGLLQAAAINGQVRICPRGAAPFVIELPGGNVSRNRSYRGSVRVEGHVDGLRWHNLSFSVHGVPLPAAEGSGNEGSGKRFFNGKVDAKTFLTLLPRLVDRSICLFVLHEFVDPVGGPGKGSSFELSSFEFVRKPDFGLFAE